MSTKDYADYAVSGADATAIEQFETACYEFRCYIVLDRKPGVFRKICRSNYKRDP